jgi:hypothetical protein
MGATERHGFKDIMKKTSGSIQSFVNKELAGYKKVSLGHTLKFFL